MKLRSLLRQALLFPLLPGVFLLELRFLRALGLLPPVAEGKWPPQRVLVVNLTGNLGDALMMLPTIDALKQALPSAEISLTVDCAMASPLRAVPALRQVFAFDAVKTSLPLFGRYLRLFRMFQFARREWTGQAYDLALLPRWGTDPFLSSYLAAMSTAPVRGGHDPQDEDDAAPPDSDTALLMTAVSRGGHGIAEAVREQRVLTTCGILGELEPDAEERRTVESILQMARAGEAATCMQRLGLAADAAFILLSPGASHPARRWPVELFVQLGGALKQRWGVSVYTIGGPGDGDLGLQIEAFSHGSVCSLVGKTSVLEAIALTQKATLLVTNDSGPAHVGGGLGVPTLVLSVCPLTSTREHANSPRRVRPVGPHVRVLQPAGPAPGCGERCLALRAHCILGITVETVLQNAEALLVDSARE